MRSDFVGDNPFFHIVSVRQSEVFFRGYVAEHCTSEPADHRCADTACDMVIAGGDVGRQRTERVKRGFVAMFKLQVHVFLDEVHRNMSGTFDHDLAVVFPCDLRKLTEGF